MNPRILQLALCAALVAVLLSTALVDPALAASTSDIGKNVGREVNSWGKAILLGLAGLLAIPVLAKRDVSGGLMLLLLVVIVGGFVFAQGTVEHAITGFWHAIAG